MTRISLLGAVFAALISLPATAQETGGVDPSFEYPAQKTCAVAPAPDGLNHQVTCTIVVDHPALVNMPFGDPPAPPQFTVIDQLTLNGQPIPGAVQTAAASTGATAQNCINGQFLDGGFLGMPTGPLPTTTGYGCHVTAAPGTMQTTLTVVSLIPLDTFGMAQNCARTQHGIPILPDAMITSVPACAQFDLPRRRPNDPLPIAPVQCEAFTPEVSCNTVTGKPVITLKNKYAKLFSPKNISITSLTPGVTVLQSKSNALSVQLTGANPGDTISLSTEAIEKGAGSEPGLDLCCMGAIEVTIPEGFICEAEQVLEVSKTCDTGINPAIDTDADCEITVYYEGPPPTAANPIKIVEAVTGNPWAFTTTPLSGDNWHCPAVPDATPFTCTISAADEPTANWQNWTSTLIVQMSVGEKFENCVTATAAGGLEDRVCWSTEMPELTIEKQADQAQCVPGQPCDFTITVSNPSNVDYAGPITINDDIIDVSPPLLAGPGSFTAITPPLCSLADLNNGTCTGTANILSGSAQSYTVTWIPPLVVAGVEADTIQVTNCATGVSQSGGMPVTGAPDPEDGILTGNFLGSCAIVDILPNDISIEKTGPDQCLPGLPCDYTITLSAGAGGYNGPMLLGDQAPEGFEVTAINPAPVGCGMNLPAQNLACVVPVSLNAGESVSYTLSITPMASTLDTAFFGENCALLGTVSEGAGPADYSYSGDAPSDEFIELISASNLMGESCAPVIWDPVGDDQGEVSVAKTCTPLVPNDNPVTLTYQTDCTISVTVTGGDYLGHLTVFDEFAAPNGGTILDPIPGSDDWSCDEGGCMIGPMGPGTYSLTVPVRDIALNTGETATNCAVAYGVPTGTGMSEADASPLPESCVTLTPPDVSDPTGDSTLTATKTCGPVIELNATGLSAAQCTITVTGTGTLPATIQLNESMLSYAGASHSGGNAPLNITGMTSLENWQFPPLPMVQSTPGGGAAPPAIATLTGPELLAAGGQSTIDVTVQFQDAGWAVESANCVQLFGLDAAGNPLNPPVQSENVCAEFTVSPPLPDVLQIAKICQPVLPFSDMDQDMIADMIACQITVTVPPGYGNGLIVLEDFLQDPAQAPANVATITSITSTDPWDCTIAGQITSPSADYCSILSDDLAGTTSTLQVTMTDNPEPQPGSFFNCVRHTDVAGSGFAQTPFACAAISNIPGGYKTADVPVLNVAKTAKGPCLPDVGSQTYACGFDLTVTNTGAAFAGPMVLGDAFDPGMVSAVSATGAGWSCNIAGDAASCINGNLSLAPGASSTVGLVVTVKGLRKGGTFGNCATLGATEDPTAQTIIVQTALTLMGADIGAVDGQAGKRTRAAVADLQEQLGLPANGQIDSALLQALGVPMAVEGAASCVAVDLPPMPEPPLVCEKATTKLVDGACACRFKNMYQADKTSCGCVKGTKFVAGEGCLKVREKVKDNPTALKCDPETTVLRGGKCQCREEGMERVNKTACAFPKKKKKKEVEIRICPNGLPEIPGIGCVDIEIKRKEKEVTCDPAVDPERCG